MTFKLWSELNKEAVEELRPNFGFRSWDVLSESDKRKIWKYLELKYFFDTEISGDYNHRFANKKGLFYKFHGDYFEQDTKQKRIGYTIAILNDLYKAQSFANKFLESGTYTEACTDFYAIFIKEKQSVVLELISLYAKDLISEKETSANSLNKENGESNLSFQKRVEAQKWLLFDEFAEDINEVFSHFGLNLYLSRLGFVPKQDDKLINEVYEPVLKSISHPIWKEVNQHLTDAFSEYRKNNPIGYSNCVTNTVTAVQAFLQIINNGKTGSGDISKLIAQAQTKNLIPSDLFSKEIFKNIESILMRERQETGIAHPKKEYATEKNAILVLNLAMIFFQHSL